jgi:hypothetical protein
MTFSVSVSQDEFPALRPVGSRSMRGAEQTYDHAVGRLDLPTLAVVGARDGPGSLCQANDNANTLQDLDTIEGASSQAIGALQVVGECISENVGLLA